MFSPVFPKTTLGLHRVAFILETEEMRFGERKLLAREELKPPPGLQHATLGPDLFYIRLSSASELLSEWHQGI